MKQKLLTILLLALLMPVVAHAYSVYKIDGIYYYFSNGEAIVTNSIGGNPNPDDPYVGDVVIPDSVTWYNRTYPVTTIGLQAFNRSNQMTSVDIPPTVTKCEFSAFTEADGLEALLNPNSPKVVVSDDGRAIYFSRSVIPYLRGVDEQEWLSRHTYYKHIGLYAYRVEVLEEITKLPQSTLEKAESLEQLRWIDNGYVIKVGETNVETIGIDTPADLERAEQFLKIR